MKQFLVLLTLWLTLFTQSSQFLIVSPVLPRIRDQLHVEAHLLGWLVTGYAIGTATFALLAGPISDQVGRRAVLRVGSAAMAVVLLAHGLAWDFTSLLVLRAFAGATSGILAGAAIAYVGDVVPYERRGAAMGVVMSAMAFGQILGIPIGSMLAAQWGYSSPFVSFGAIMVAACALTFTALPAAPLGADRGPPFGVREAMRSYAELWVRRDVQAVAVAGALMMWSVASFVVYQPVWLEDHFRASPAAVASLFLVGGTANALTGPLSGRLSDRVGRKGLVVFGSYAMAGLMMITPFAPNFGVIYVLFFLIMGAVGLRLSPYNALLTAMVDAHHRGTLMSLSLAASQVGFAVGAAVAGPSFDAFGYAGNAIAAGLGAVGVGAIIGAFVPEPGEEHVAKEVPQSL